MDSTITININNLTEAELEQAIELMNKANNPSGVLKFKYGDIYFYIGDLGNVKYCVWRGDVVDNVRDVIGNCYKTKKEAEFALEYQKVIVELERYAEEHNEVELDWENDSQRKYYICYNYINNHIDISSNYGFKHNEIYFAPKDVAISAIKAIGKNRIKKYYLKVED